MDEDSPEKAYNPETGEVNWDCPCLKGLAQDDKPCKDEFKISFSCFVESQSEKKGIECVDKFLEMQQCFKKYPDVYAKEYVEDHVPID